MKMLREELLRGSSIVLTRVGRLEPFTKSGQNYVHPSTGELRRADPRRHIRLVLSQHLKRDL